MAASFFVLLAVILFCVVFAIASSSSESNTALRSRSLMTTTASQWLVQQYYSSNSCTGVVGVANAIGTNMCYPTSSGTYTSGTFAGNSGAFNVYSDSYCTVVVSGSTPTLFTLNQCVASPDLFNGVTVYYKYVLQSSPSPTYSGTGLLNSYYSSLNCNSDPNSALYAWTFSATSSNGCLLTSSIPGSNAINSKAYTCSSYGNVNEYTYSNSNSCGGSPSSTTVFSSESCNSATSFLFSGVLLSVAGSAVSCYTGATGPLSPPVSCFAGSEMITVISGEAKSISDVVVGDSILTFSTSTANTVFSDVIATPHPRNNIAADFQHITADDGSDIKMTADHLILSGACSNDDELSLIRAADVLKGSCIQTIDGRRVVSSNEVVKGEGLYTVITENSHHLVVVNKVVASSFAVNHVVGNAVYAIHRLVYAICPSILAATGFHVVNTIASTLAGYFTK